VEDRILHPLFFFRSCDSVSLNVRGRDGKRFTLYGRTSAASTTPAKGVLWRVNCESRMVFLVYLVYLVCLVELD
jgi:hypothetical protein